MGSWECEKAKKKEKKKVLKSEWKLRFLFALLRFNPGGLYITPIYTLAQMMHRGQKWIDLCPTEGAL